MFIAKTQGFIDKSMKSALWRGVAGEHKGTFTVMQTGSENSATLVSKIPYHQYLVEFTESDTHPLKIICKLNVNHKFELFIKYEDSLGKILKFIEHQDILYI